MAGQKKCHMCRVACHCVRQKQLAHLAAAQASIRVAHSTQHHLHLFQRPCRLPCCQRAVPACVQPDMCGHWTQVCPAQLAEIFHESGFHEPVGDCWLFLAGDCCCTSAVCSYRCTKHGVVSNSEQDGEYPQKGKAVVLHSLLVNQPIHGCNAILLVPHQRQCGFIPA
jgi:hypothetical protein